MILILIVLISTWLIETFCKSFIGWQNIKLFEYFFAYALFATSVSYFINYVIYPSNIQAIEMIFFTWLNLSNTTIHFSFLIDNLSLSMMLVVINISNLVKIYSMFYMKTDKNICKFFSYLTAFTIFMLILIFGSNFLVLFLGWEGVGICSFLLISFWNTRSQANKSAIKAMLINRVGDFFLLAAMALIYNNFLTLNFLSIFSLVHIYSFKMVSIFNYKISIITIISLLLLIGAVTKSAQIFFHTWLPDAMEAPTPVSALIHAATMVTAGVYLIIRCSYIFEYSAFTLQLTKYFGALSIVIFGIIAIFQYDIKKIIAYSTCSQLGYMILSCGLSGYNLALFHLFCHASFKALLLLSAGTIIHTYNNEQDIRRLNGITKKLPLISISFLIGTLSIIGFPFFSGFYSKEPIILLAYLDKTNFSIYLYAILGVVLTFIYSMRLVYYLYFKEENCSRRNKILNTNELDINNIFVILVLSMLSITSGYFFKIWFIGAGNNNFTNSIFILSNHTNLLKLEYCNFGIKVVPILIICFGLLIFKYCVTTNKKIEINRNLQILFTNKMFFDSIYNLIAFYFLQLSFRMYKIVEKGTLELIGPYGLTLLLKKINYIFENSINSFYLTYWVFQFFFHLIFYISLFIFVLIFFF